MDTDILRQQFWDQLSSCNNGTTKKYLSSLRTLVYQSYWQNRFSQPMRSIGMYIALASLFCLLAMVADLLHGLRNRKLWFPCKYFTLNAASLTVIAVAIKLPMDLTNQTQAAKLGSLAFMCTMMANLLPSLATMNSKELVSNIIALGVLVITLVVNVCIQISTEVFSHQKDEFASGGNVHYAEIEPVFLSATQDYVLVGFIYVGVLPLLLVLYACTSLAILTSKQILESKYQATLKGQVLQQPGRLTIEKLKEHVSNYSIMATTGNPQFMAACSATTTASAVICAISSNSDYKWSMMVILIIQFIGTMVFKVEIYWIQKLSDWKQSSIPLPSRRLQDSYPELEKPNSLHLYRISEDSCCSMQDDNSDTTFATFSTYLGIVLAHKPDEIGTDEDLSRYVLQLQDQMEFPERALKGILKSVNDLIKKAEKQQPKNLMNLLAESQGFEGVKQLDNHHVKSLLSEEYLSCWSLPLVTLTAIAMSLTNIQRNTFDSLLSGVSEGLLYVTLVEESTNATDDHVVIQRAAKTLWVEVEIYHKWLGNRLQKPTPQAITTIGILRWLSDTAKSIVTEVGSTDIGGRNDKSKFRSISANSMYRITETIMLSYDANLINQLSQEELFGKLSSMIADILAACLTNLPHVIAMKCHTSVIEKREASVQAAAQLLGETTQIINTMQDRELPTLNHDELVFIEKWHAYLKLPFP
ncbi:uncharacterized protein LOC111896628 [Lactuca sativa]|uniref:uncharacterized protein LOC111896628 n=1 Tax=Lactuca sativa TaxID=4236 RepID=UPI000CD7EC2C|nr:uncharacterized protein LOC111896628 [Lactuca sativa]